MIMLNAFHQAIAKQISLLQQQQFTESQQLIIFCQIVVNIMDDDAYLGSKEEYNPKIIIQGIRQTSKNIQHQRSIRKLQQQKYKKLMAKIHSLQTFQKKSQRESSIIQSRLNKLQQNQTFAVWLLRNKIQNIKFQQKQLQKRHQQCINQKADIQRSLQRSQTFYDNRKKVIVNNIKSQLLQIKQQHFRKLSQSHGQIKKQKDKVKKQEEQIRQRLKRYEEFKLQVARQNYQNKVKKELQNHKEKEKLLKQLKLKVSKQENIFRKTQILDQQADRANSIYITSQHH